jgi:hypothetical protein
MLGHNTNLNKFKKTEIISYVIYNYNDLKLELVLSNGRNFRKYTNTWKLNNKLLKTK